MQNGPVLVHVVTKKGHGYAPAEASNDKYHGVSKFNVVTGEQVKATPSAPSYTGVFAEALMDEAARDLKIVAITAAMPSGTGLDKFALKYPERCFDVGIAEQHAVTLQPVWPAKASNLLPRFTRPFCSALMIKWCMMLRCKICRCASPLTVPVWSALMGRPMPVHLTMPISAHCPIW